MDKCIVVTYWKYRTECGYVINEFNSEEEAIKYSETLTEDEFYCVAKVIKE